MLRFTLHRPSQNSAVSTCCHGMPCRDVSGRVHVGVRPVPASHTYEGRLALATLRCDVLAGITGLRRVRSFHFFDPAGSLLLQPAREQTPPGFEDAPVEPGLLCEVPARILHGSGSGASHAFDGEVLDPDHVEPASEVGAGFLKPVFAPVAIPGFQPADQGPDFPAAVRPAPGAGESALQPQEPLSFLRPQTLRAGHLTRGQCHRDSDTPIHADDAAGAWGGDRFRDHSERDMPTTRPLACDAVRLPVHESAAAFEPNPADLRPPAHWPVPGCRGGPAQPQARRSANPHARRLYATSGLRLCGSAATTGHGPVCWWAKIGWVSFKRSRALMDWKSYRITRERAGRWHIAFAVIPEPIPAPGVGGVVGVDRGVTLAVALSTGEMSSPGGLSLKEAERLLRLQRRLARPARGSNSRRKVRTLIAGLKAKDGDRRKDWVEKTSTDLARRFDVIRLENLNVKGMTRSARGTMENPGRNVAQKAGLNRGILKSGWGLLVARLEQKAPGRVEEVKAAYTSQTCNACKHIAAQSRKSQATFVCVACGHRANADVNGARNIAAGHAVPARGDRRVLARSVKREPQHARPSKVA